MKTLAASLYESSTQEKILVWTICCAALSFIPTLFLPHFGEEGVYTITTQEMLFANYYWDPIIYGGYYDRPPMFNWLMIGVAYIVGHNNILLAARIVTALATMGIAFFTGFLTLRVTKNKIFSLWSVAIFLSGDLLFRRGWMAYADPVFSFFTFASTALLWLALQEKQTRWLFFSCICLFAAYLSKVYTVFVFYGLASLVLLWKIKGSRKVLFSSRSFIYHGLVIFGVYMWSKHNFSGNLFSTVENVGQLYDFANLLAYAKKVLFFPLNCIFLMLPTSLIVIWGLFIKKERVTYKDNFFQITCLILLLNVLPYWLSPRLHVRYLISLYPLMAIALGYLIMQMRGKLQSLATTMLLVAVGIKFLIAFFWYPYEQTVLKGDAKQVAQQMLKIVGENDLYIADSTSIGLRVAAEINKLRYPAKPLNSPNHSLDYNKNGFIIGRQADKSIYTEKRFALGKESLALFIPSEK